MKFENTKVFNFEGAVRGMRNPMNSWDKSDSHYREIANTDDAEKIVKGDYYYIGKNDLELAQKLIKAGSEHRKFMRQIFVSVDITAPLYWWKEFDTYKVGIIANSTSTMHKLASTPITKECFETDDFIQRDTSFETDNIYHIWNELIIHLEKIRETYNETKDKRYWKELIRLLPESWLQKRTVTMSYENILAIIHQRKNHKLIEWSENFMSWMRSLPYANDLLFL